MYPKVRWDTLIVELQETHQPPFALMVGPTTDLVDCKEYTRPHAHMHTRMHTAHKNCHAYTVHGV